MTFLLYLIVFVLPALMVVHCGRMFWRGWSGRKTNPVHFSWSHVLQARRWKAKSAPHQIGESLFGVMIILLPYFWWFVLVPYWRKH